MIDENARIAYEYHATKAIMQALGITIELDSPEPGDVAVVVNVPAAYVERVLEALEERLNDMNVRPWTDHVMISVRAF